MKEPIARLLRKDVDAVAIDRVGARLRARPALTRVQRPSVRAVLIVLAAAAALVFAVRHRSLSDERRLADGTPLLALEAPQHDTAFELSDGTEIELSVGARVERIQNDGARLVLQQSTGRVHYRVAPQSGRTFVIEAGVATIEVVGTEFTVDRSVVEGSEHLDVRVTHGVVVVRSDQIEDHVARLEAGDHLVIGGPSVTPLEASEPAPSGSDPLQPALAPEPMEPPPVDRGIRRVEPVAIALPEEAPTPESPAGEALPSDDALLARADVLRRAGRLTDARDLLEQVLAGGRAPQASLAAFSLGVMFDEGLHDAARAEAMLERALALGLPAALFGVAWSRLAVLRGQRGDLDGARDAAQQALAAGVMGRDRERALPWQ